MLPLVCRMFWLSPLQYTFTGLANNELSGESYRDPGELSADVAPRGLGHYVLEQNQFMIANKWRCAALLWLPPAC